MTLCSDYKKTDEAALWFVVHGDGSKKQAVYKYRENMDLMQLARYVKSLDKELVVGVFVKMRMINCVYMQ